MALKCKHCQEEAYDIDEQVCKACGVVNDDIQFESECTPGLSFKSYQYSTYKKKRQLVALNYGTNILDSLCHEFNVAADVKMDAVTLLNFVYDSHIKANKGFKFKEDVGILAGCCLLNIHKEHRQLIQLSTLCTKLKCKKKRAFKFMKLLKSYLPQDPDEVTNYRENNFISIEDEIKIKHLPVENDGFPDSLVSSVNTLLSKVPEDKKAELIKKTLSLLKLAYSCWLLTGRSRDGVIISAAYLCWKSMHATLRSISLTRFCDDFSLNKNKTHHRVPELKSMLLKLAQNIPSPTKNYVNERNLFFHLDYILENSQSLRNDFLMDEFTNDDMNQKEYNLYRAEYQKPQPHANPDTQYDSDMNASEVEISDSEISSYIRSDEQVEFIKKLMESKNNSEPVL